ncbi:MAG: anti-sigma regulatory factor [Oscillochloris sp.]|nr:anti-sigma regulatory factor [Oscillochloris sp.]
MQSVTCTIAREVDVYVAMSRGREFARHIGLNDVDRTRIEIVILELARNLIVHAGDGSLQFSILNDASHGVGLAIEANDEGPGIADINLAMQDGYSTSHTLGAGLPGVRRLMDEFTIRSTPGVGTQVRAVKWARTPHRKRTYGS